MNWFEAIKVAVLSQPNEAISQPNKTLDGVRCFIQLIQAPKDWPKSHGEMVESKCCLSQGSVDKEIWTGSLHGPCTFTFLLSPDYWAGFTLLLPSLISWIKLGAYGIHPATSQSKEQSLHISHIFNHQDVSNGSSSCQVSVEAGSLCQTTGGAEWVLGSCPSFKDALHTGQLLAVSPPLLFCSLLTEGSEIPGYCMVEASH